MEQHWVLEGGGTLTCREENGKVILDVVSPQDGAGLYKVWVHGAQGRSLLGTLVPENGKLLLSRTLTRSSLAEKGCWPLTGGEKVLAFSFQKQDTPWQDHWNGVLPMKDPVLVQCLNNHVPLLFRTWNEGIQIAQRFLPKEAVVLSPLICLSEAMWIRDSLYLVWTFDAQGNPVIPPQKAERKP